MFAPNSTTPTTGLPTAAPTAESTAARPGELEQQAAGGEAGLAAGGVDAAEVIRQLAAPEDESLLSAALLVRDQVQLTAETPDSDLPQVTTRLDQLLREDLQLVSRETAAVA